MPRNQIPSNNQVGLSHTGKIRLLMFFLLEQINRNAVGGEEQLHSANRLGVVPPMGHQAIIQGRLQPAGKLCHVSLVGGVYLAVVCEADSSGI